MADEDDSKMVAYLKEHPRAMGALFTITLLLSQAAPVIADGGQGSGGP